MGAWVSVESVDITKKISFGKYWAAYREGYIVGLISMDIPKDSDFELYSELAKKCLAVLGDVKWGELVSINGVSYLFIKGNGRHSGRKRSIASKLYPLKSQFDKSEVGV